MIDEAKWWEEDAARLNALAELAKNEDVTVDVITGKTPAFNANGSLKKQPLKKVSKLLKKK